MKAFNFLVCVFATFGLIHANANGCQDFEMFCDNGKCVSGYFICDGNNDCGDMSDEGGESGICPRCPPYWFQCTDSRRCIQPSSICDGRNDCGDHSDEGGASGICPKCEFGFFQCGNGRCTWPYFVCDGRNDCGDGSDENDDTGTCPECPPDSFVCNNGKCFFHFHVCDGIDDCGDGSDEAETLCQSVKHNRNGTANLHKSSMRKPMSNPMKQRKPQKSFKLRGQHAPKHL